jgi:Lysyl oxidase
VTKVLVARVMPVVVAIALAAVTMVVAVRPLGAAAGSNRLPDLDQVEPTNVVITRAGTRSRPVYRLGFESAVENVGDGPLIIDAHRPDPNTRTMAGDQLIERDEAPTAVVRGAGRLRYVVSPDHRHWHLLGFDRYELRRAGRRVAAVRDRKTGFCLGDRYAVTGRHHLETAPPEPVHTSRCGLGEPGLIGIQEGISVGYGDNYQANLEGQFLPLTGLRSGRYVLVHRVNADRRLRELDYRNNAASLLLELRWPRGAPAVRLLRVCPRTDRCDRHRAR